MNVDNPILDAVVWVALGIIAVTLWAVVVRLGIRGNL